MKLFFLLTLMSFAGHHHQSSHDPASVHGMLIVGSHRVYLSHLPMFHSPLDYQTLLAVEFEDEAMKTYVSHLKTKNQTVYTLVPEPFVLPDMIKHPKAFQAQIFLGHFERGGKPIASTLVKVKEILYFQKFKQNAQKPEFAQGLVFGNSQEQFLAHVISSAPDFDQILKIQASSRFKALLAQNSKPIPVDFWEVPNQPLPASADLSADIKSKASLYLETRDLSD